VGDETLLMGPAKRTQGPNRISAEAWGQGHVWMKVDPLANPLPRTPVHLLHDVHESMDHRLRVIRQQLDFRSTRLPGSIK
jgi:hypothetical protein